ncbi:sensor histidine kinase [Neolewinella antarctica]|uniref:histidine kinase n=1 Tax=Neolewinella antarctica TaxID=442734 RepID=A0ABX0XDX9_9BACT|nr:ATP-binding protein [Neolewinella antarctica]NJC27290.1 signal transduction histidine kinase [Neolewinella antarctica]
MKTSEPHQRQQKILRALIAGALVLLVMFAVAFFNQLRIGTIRDTAGDTLGLERNLAAILTAVKEGESSERAFLLTTDDAYLAAYKNGKQQAFNNLTEARQQLTVLQRPSLSIDTLQVAITEKFATLDQRVASVRASAANGPLVAEADRKLTAQITHTINRLSEGERRQIAELRTRIDRMHKLTAGLLLFSLFALFGLIYYLYTRYYPLVLQVAQSIERRDDEIDQRRIAEARALTLIDALKSKNKELDHFAYIASHDLQEPLRTVSNFIELLEEEQGHNFNEDANTYVNFINQATDRMRELITQLLRYSQIGRDDESQRVDLNESVAMALINLRPVIQESSARITVQLLPNIEGHPVELTELFQNLLGNAIKFTPPGRVPIITVTNSVKNNEVTIDITDNGIGITKVARGKIFNMFSKVHPSGAYQGHGIGLTFCRRIIELHSGRLTLLPAAEIGSTFRFTLDTYVYEKEIKADITD